ncbi:MULTISPECIES: type VII secretion protein EccCa [unclassified Gordonia (in: high G+C Gram-positive bacteria)]|uniref:type VII secretion protein EccCa n=1 Tax=unclassified Gordonia (in: high G+C Gram-positive bacteria) TaxID=2657482 RepID=UPI001F051B2B|nr:type VII secretion protein EccCa [Gordonia sp. PDNC005]
MGTRLVHRPARLKVDPLPSEPLKLPPAPAIDSGNNNPMMAMRAILPIFAGLGMMAMMMSSGNPIRMIAGGAMVTAAVIGGIAMFIYAKSGGRKKAEQQRGVYVEFVAEARQRLDQESADQRAVSVRRHPEPRALLNLIRDPSRLWERRPHDDDFLVARIGRGTGPLARDVDVPDQADPLKKPEPIAQAHLDRLISATKRIEDLPVAVQLAGVVSIVGPAELTYEAVRGILTQVGALHAPDDVRFHLALPAAGASTAYQWAMWLPHILDPDRFDGPIGRRMTSRDSDDLVSFIDEIDERARLVDEIAKRSASSSKGIDAPHLVVVIDSDDQHGREVLSVLSGRDLQAMKVVAVVLNEQRTLEPGHVDARITIADNRSVEVEIFGDDTESNARVDAAQRRTRRLVRGADRGSLDAVSETLAATIARRLAPIRLIEDAAPDTPLESTITLDRLLGISDFGTYDVHQMWSPRPLDEFLNVPFAVGGNGEPVHLNLKESAQEGMGPHGLCIGATGSGKSEVLRTMVLAQAVCHSPDRLALVLVDYKGGAAFAGLDQLPHTTAMVDNLSDGAGLVDRLHDALLGEMQRRQQVLQAAGSLPNVTEYNRRRDAGQDLEPLPNLLVVIDEFGEILAAKPDFIDLFVQIGRIGRSIGVHLLLATQRLEESKLRGLESHLSYRIGLRTFSAQESRTVIGTTDAHQLPPIPGSGILKVDPDLYERFKAAYVSGRYVPAGAAEELQLPPVPMPFQLGNDTSHWLHERQLEHELAVQKNVAPADEDDPFVETTLDMVARRLGEHADKVRQIWLPPLPDSIPIGEVLGDVAPSRGRGLSAVDTAMCGQLKFPIGLKDQPLKQWQGPLTLDVRGSGGHVVFLGSPQSGKTTAVRAIVMGAALTHTATEVGFYVIDMAGSSLSPLANLPHVGDVATRFESDKLRRSVAEVAFQLAERERIFADHQIETAEAMREAHRRGALPELACADVFLVIDGWWTFREEYEALSQQVQDIVARGLGYGVHVILTSSRWADFRLQMQSMLGTRVELRLNDALESTIDRRTLASIRPEDQGRCATQDKLLGQIALPQVGGSIGGAEASLRAIADAWTGPVIPPVRMLPDEVTLATIRSDHPTAPRAVIGLAEADLMPASIDLFGTDPHLLVFGDSGSGKTSLVRTLINDICPAYKEGQVVFAVIDPKRQLLDAVPPQFLGGYAGTGGAATGLMGSIAQELVRRQPPDDVTPQQLRDRSWWKGPEVVIIADDYDLIEGGNSPLRQLVPFLSQSRDLGVHLVVLRRSGGAARAAYEHVMQGIKESGGTGLLLSGDRQEGQIWPKAWLQHLPPGRGDLIRPGKLPERIQVAFTPSPLLVSAALDKHTAPTAEG